MDWLLAIPVWGEAYHALFARDIWPTIKRALAGASGRVRFVFHTDDSAAIRELIPDVEAVFLWPPAGETWQSYSQSHREAAKFASKGEAIAFLNADIVVSEECFAAAEKRFAEGKRAIVMQATRTIGSLMQKPPTRSRQLLEWSLLFAHNMARECFWPQGQTTVPCTIYYTDGDNVILRAFFLHPFAVVKGPDMHFHGTVDQDALDPLPYEQIHVVTDADEAALASIDLSLTKRLPILPGPLCDDAIMAWADGATSAHHREFFKKRIVMRGSAETECDHPADTILRRMKSNTVELEVMRRWYQGALRHAEGYMSKAVEAWGAAMDFQYEKAAEAGVPPSPRYLADDWTGNIGHPTYLDLFVKGMKLGAWEHEYVLLADADKVSTPTYLRLWQPHIKMFQKTGYPYDWRLTREPTAVVKLHGKWRWFVDAHCEIEKRWLVHGGDPLIALPEDEVAKGWEKIGLHRDRDWFVCLHVREGRDGQAGRDGHRDSYRKAKARIERWGGHAIWVPTGDRELDIFLMAQARFIIANNAGPSLVAGTFGVPLVGADWYPVGIGYPYQGAILLRKRMKVHGRLLSLGEQCTEPYNHVQNPEIMAGLGIELVPNTAEEIAAAAMTMMEKTEYGR